MEMARIKINKGFISHNGQLYKAGEIVDIADAEYAKRIVARSDNDFEFYHGEDIPGDNGSEPPVASDENGLETANNNGGASDLDHGGEQLPAVDAEAAVKTAKPAKSKRK